ncbi:MAG: NADH-quinone oxidoreductase subunit NuoH [Coriobacteriia bacterium]|nr:NADH-quinone oxidoreductase subunit NuoH [Coriobacteriia bacterium]
MSPWLIAALRFVAALGLLLVNGVVMIWMLRKVLAFLHLRLGPMEQGPHGVFQTLFDVVKLLTKEDITPRAVDRWLHFLAPAIVFVPSLMAYIVLPFSKTWVVADLSLGLLFGFAIMSLIPLGILMAGWSSNNKWSLIGAMRVVGAQITYEVPMLLAALPVVMMAGSLNMNTIVAAQSHVWFVVNLPAFILFFIAGLIESGQTPFDLIEADSELVSGYATEYSAMKFGLLFLSEFSNVFVFSAMMVTLFFGGWQGGFGIIPAPVVFMLKTYIGIFILMTIRGTMPRVRVDNLLALGWKFLLPASIAWTMITAFVLKLAPGLIGGGR